MTLPPLSLAGARLACLLLFCLSCTTTPKPIHEVDLPKSIDTVWLRADHHHPALFVHMPTPVRGAMSDTGRLTVAEDHLLYEGRLYSIEIPYPDVTNLQFGRRGGDFINRWITVHYEFEGSYGEVAFSAGKALGWAGGSAGIYSLVEYGLRSYREQQGARIREPAASSRTSEAPR